MSKMILKICLCVAFLLNIANIQAFKTKLNNIGLRQISNLHENKANFFDSLTSMFNSPAKKTPTPQEPVKPVESYLEEISEKKSLLIKTANKEVEASDSDTIVQNLLDLEKLMRKQNKADEGETAKYTVDKLNGAWRLIFTTGTAETQKKLGRRINYFPIKAVQCFDTTNYKITNGIYINNFPVLKFFGTFDFNLKSRKLTFDFNDIAVLGLKFSLGSDGAGKIGKTTGLGSEGSTAESDISTDTTDTISNTTTTTKKGRQPFFNWISADDDIATARGGGGGLALWKRDTTTPYLMS